MSGSYYSLITYKASPPARSSGTDGVMMSDIVGNLNVNVNTYISGEDSPNDVLKVEQQMSYTNITTNTNTIIKTGVGYIKGFTINNTALLTVTNLTITVYDNSAASGTIIGTFTVPFGLTTALPFEIELCTKFNTGLTIATAGPTVPANITVAWR